MVLADAVRETVHGIRPDDLVRSSLGRYTDMGTDLRIREGYVSGRVVDMLEDDDIRDLLGSVLGSIYGPAVLVTKTRGTVRDQDTGGFPENTTRTDVSVQRDVCTTKQMGQAGYSDKDVRMIVLQSGVSVVPNTDSEIEHRGETFLVMDVDEDPFRVYWDLRSRRK